MEKMIKECSIEIKKKELLNFVEKRDIQLKISRVYNVFRTLVPFYWHKEAHESLYVS